MNIPGIDRNTVCTNKSYYIFVGSFTKKINVIGLRISFIGKAISLPTQKNLNDLVYWSGSKVKPTSTKVDENNLS